MYQLLLEQKDQEISNLQTKPRMSRGATIIAIHLENQLKEEKQGFEVIRKENEDLKKLTLELKKELAKLKIDLASLDKENAKLKSKNMEDSQSKFWKESK